MHSLSIGKIRSLQQCSTANGAISVLALDHRNNLRQMLNPAAPEAVTLEEMTAFKQQVIASLAPAATAVLLDPQVGAAQCIASGVLPGSVGLVSSIEASGYTGDPNARESRIMPGWSVAKAKRMGASAIKLLVYYHPDAPTASMIETLVAEVVEACRAADVLFFLEPLSYSSDPVQKKLSPGERRRVVVETARRLVLPGVDVLKAEFPLDISAEPDERSWAAACAELSQASRAPWVLLSASAGFETFLRMVTVACQEGAAGVAVGRAVWQEAPALLPPDRQRFLQHVARPRLERITALCSALAKPWSAFYTAGSITPEWHQNYGG